jgi:hypothetical protein
VWIDRQQHHRRMIDLTDRSGMTDKTDKTATAMKEHLTTIAL